MTAKSTNCSTTDLSIPSDINSNFNSKKKLRIYSLSILFIAVVFYFVGAKLAPILATKIDERFSSSSDDLTTPNIYYYNEYTKTRPLSGDYPWTNIVEPYRITTFIVSNSRPGHNYEWYIDDWHVDDGDSVDMVFSEVKGTIQTVTVKMIMTVTKEVVSTASIDVICKYVRREIRALNDQDREAFFQAVSIMQRVPTQTGKKLYGDNYRSKDFFNRLHLYFGGSKSCDHWHQGPGFATSHITMSLMFEKSLQTINPSISLPYWDFTLESTFYEPDTFRGSGVFTDDWFGEAECNNSYHTMTTGRFAFVPVMKNAENYSSIISPFGLLRSPWNTSPYAFATRSALIYSIKNNLKPSGCTEYNHALGFNNWKSLWKQLNANLHGHIHELVGGSWNPDEHIKMPTSAAGMVNAYEFAHATEAFSKILWRYDVLVCPESCTLGVTRPRDCTCVCTEESYQGMTPAHILSSTGIIKFLVFYDKDGNPISDWQNISTHKTYEQLPGYSYEETQDIYDDIMRVLCNPGYIGDMFQATSTNDITFWILHPSLDRAWHLIRLNAYNNKISFDDTWDDEDVSCHGHYADDHTPFKNIFDNDNRVYTNRELYDLIHPAQDSYPYIYDGFEWTHCSFLGYDMTGLS